MTGGPARAAPSGGSRFPEASGMSALEAVARVAGIVAGNRVLHRLFPASREAVEKPSRMGGG